MMIIYPKLQIYKTNEYGELQVIVLIFSSHMHCGYGNPVRSYGAGRSCEDG